MHLHHKKNDSLRYVLRQFAIFRAVSKKMELLDIITANSFLEPA